MSYLRPVLGHDLFLHEYPGYFRRAVNGKWTAHKNGVELTPSVIDKLNAHFDKHISDGSCVIAVVDKKTSPIFTKSYRGNNDNRTRQS